MNGRGLRRLLACGLLPLLASGQQPAPTVTLTSNSTTLQLPGSLTLQATVAPANTPSGMPSGSVQFFNGSNSLGTAVLSAIPSTENFADHAQASTTFGTSPLGIFTLSQSGSAYSVLGVLDEGPTDPTTSSRYPRLTIYSGRGANLFQTSAAYIMSNSGISYPYYNDSFGIGDFNHDGVPDVVIRGGTTQRVPQYYVLPGKSDGTFDIKSTLISPDSSKISCDCGFPTESIVVDDFDGDGYPDVGYTADGAYNGAQSGVALNVGSGNPGIFKTVVAAPALTPTVMYEYFTSVAAASGHFTSSGYPDLVVAGYSSVSKGYVALYLNQGVSEGTLSFANAALFAAGNKPVAIATADFRANGTTDVLVANANSDGTSGNIQVLIGNGKGTLTTSSTVQLSKVPASVLVADFNKDGFLDIVVIASDGSLFVLLNDGKGKFTTANSIGSNGATSYAAAGDFNGDGLTDIAVLTKPISSTTSLSSAAEFLNSASAQASLVTPAQSLPAGTDTLTASFPADNNFAAATSTGLAVTVTQTMSTLTWPPPGAMEYGVPLGSAQLNATANFPGMITYTPGAGTVLPPGVTPMKATFVPSDTFDYAGAIATQNIAVTAPSITSIAPTGANLGDANTTITINGQGLVKGAVVEWNGSPLASTWVSLNQLTAVIPAALLTAAGTRTITAVDSNNVAVAGSQIFTIVAGNLVAKATAPATADAGQNSSITLTVSPYPVAITATLTLTFTPDPPNAAIDPTVVFPNNTTTEVIQIPANSAAALPPINFSTGSTAGTITLTVQLSAGGVNVTPSSLAPVSIAVPAAPPSITSVVLSRSGTEMTVAIRGFSPTRTMTQAAFHFTAAAGKNLKTTDLTVDLTTPFSNWYQSTNSASFGTTFLYTQPFTLTTDASSVGGVSVTLTNPQGTSQPGTAQ